VDPLTNCVTKDCALASSAPVPRVLHQARSLLVGGLVEAFLVQLDARLRAANSARTLSKEGSVWEVTLTSAR